MAPWLSPKAPTAPTILAAECRGRPRCTPHVKMTIQPGPRSNTIIGFGGFVLTFALCYVAYRIQFSQPRLAALIGVASFSFVFMAVAFAQLRSGYLWRNLSPGNRGGHHSESPSRFILSTVFHFVLALGIVGFALWRYTHDA